MCMLTGPVKAVNATKIYVSASEDSTRQLTVYANTVSTPKGNAMVLPVPAPAASVKFWDMSDRPDFFKQLGSCFMMLSFRGFRGATLSSNDSFSASNEVLEVVQVGSYAASIVPSIADFGRLDAELRLDSGLTSVLSENYASGFCFIVCKLRSGSHAYHPFAYSHARSADATQAKTLFVPTRHYHLEFGVDAWGLPTTRGKASGRPPKVDADWDHEIYTANTKLHNGDMYIFKDTSSVAWDSVPPEFRWAHAAKLTKWEQEGDYVNVDLRPEIVVA